MSCTAGIPTKDRYDTLVLTLLGIAYQTRKPDHIIIIDDSDRPVDLRTLTPYQCVFELFNQKGITFQLEYGRRMGQHLSHQRIQEMASTDWIWRIDDDEIPEANVLSILLGDAIVAWNVGAVGGLVLHPNPSAVPENAANSIRDVNLPNVQWFRHPGKPQVLHVDHLHSTFLYRRGEQKYEAFLSPAAHREETLFSYGLKRLGFSLLVDTEAVTWHFRSGTGGIRSYQNPQFWEQDEKLFQNKLSEWGVTGDQVKYIVLDAGRGDHVIVKTLLPRLKEKYGKVIAATCYRDIFNGEVEQISIAEAHQRLGNLDRFNVYRWCQENNWRDNLVGAYEKMWELA